MTGFKKRAVSVDRVSAVEEAAAASPIVGDPRMASVASSQLADLGASQDRSTGPGSTGYSAGMLYDIPVGRLRSNPFNPRAVYTAAAVDDMALSLSEGGQRISATGYLGDAGDVVLIEGETRLRGARAAGLLTLRVEIKARPASDRELYEEARAANVERREQTPLDDALRWRELIAKKIYPTQTALAKALKLGEDHVSRTLSLANLPTKLIHAVAEAPELLTHKMLNAIREFWEAQGDESALELIREAAKTGMGYRDVVARRKAAAAGPVKRSRASRESIVFQGAKGELKLFEEGGRVEFAVKGLSPESARVLQAKILALFAQA